MAMTLQENMFSIRWRLKWFTLGIVFFFFCFVIYYEVSTHVAGAYSYKNVGRLCQTSPEEMKEMIELIRSTHDVLDRLEIRHFLVYGRETSTKIKDSTALNSQLFTGASIWGALRFKNPLPWDYDFDFGVTRRELERVPISILRENLRQEKIKFYYRAYAGVYRVERGRAGGDIIIFQDWSENGIMQRIGFESYFLFLHYRKYHQFPARLINGPLPQTEFAGVNISIPKDGNEILKFLYPTNWWMEVKPSGC